MANLFTPAAAAALAVVVAVVAEIVFPGRSVYHAGWFNVALLGLVAVAALSARKQISRAPSRIGRGAIVAMIFGAAAAGLAGAASGLLAPDNQTIVGAPGQRVRVDDLGATLEFPLAARAGADASSSSESDVTLERAGRRAFSIPQRGRNAGSFILRSLPRQVVYVEARDLHGGRLTVTQPAGSAFLSPVLLMQQRQTIAGLSLPFDSFAVPAAHRIVKAVLFTSQEAAALPGMGTRAGAPVVLFAVDDENDHPLPRAIDADRNGATIEVGGLLLRAAVLTYPAIEIVAAPALAAVIAGTLLVLAGLIAQGSDGRFKTPPST